MPYMGTVSAWFYPEELDKVGSPEYVPTMEEDYDAGYAAGFKAAKMEYFEGVMH